ncbi:MAG: phosphoribosylformylglycinamidine cyclo-ligase [Clostridia bacterium]|nr:phosphoribosylformylglycinamidine cyclo-ligase [Clostridia bacterium]
MPISYKDSGVDVTRGYEAVKLMKGYARETYNSLTLSDLGSFGGFMSLPAGYREPVLVSGADGVGTKLKLAFLADIHDTIGVDVVAMCVNDIVAQGAKPLYFLDYFATGGLDPQKAADVVKGVSRGCKEAGCVLIGGETAEMPGFYPPGEYDLAGFSTGVVEKEKIITGKDIKEGDVLYGIPSSGLHSNGFSLVRKLFGEKKKKLCVHSDELGGRIIDVLLTPTKIYVKTVLSVLDAGVDVKGMAHITGGGFIENIPRMMPEGLGCEVKINQGEIPPIFKMIKRMSGLCDEELYNTFNMGTGFVIIVSPDEAQKLEDCLAGLGERYWEMGEVKKGGGVKLVG